MVQDSCFNNSGRQETDSCDANEVGMLQFSVLLFITSKVKII